MQSPFLIYGHIPGSDILSVACKVDLTNGGTWPSGCASDYRGVLLLFKFWAILVSSESLYINSPEQSGSTQICASKGKQTV